MREVTKLSTEEKLIHDLLFSKEVTFNISLADYPTTKDKNAYIKMLKNAIEKGRIIIVTESMSNTKAEGAVWKIKLRR